MDAAEYWNFFLETGAPEIYLMYAKAMKSEGQDVSENQSFGHPCNRIPGP